MPGFAKLHAIIPVFCHASTSKGQSDNSGILEMFSAKQKGTIWLKRSPFLLSRPRLFDAIAFPIHFQHVSLMGKEVWEGPGEVPSFHRGTENIKQSFHCPLGTNNQVHHLLHEPAQ